MEILFEVVKAVALLVVWWVIYLVVTLLFCRFVSIRVPMWLFFGLIYGIPLGLGMVAFIYLGFLPTYGVIYGLVYGGILASGALVPLGLGYLAAYAEYSNRVHGYY